MTPLIQIPESVHAILSPSKAHMWLTCAGALGASKGLPNKPSRYAAEGTVYHDVSRRALLEDKDCSAYVGDRYKVGEFEFVVDEDNAEKAQEYVDLVRSLPGKRFVEVELEYSKLLPGVPRAAAIIDEKGNVVGEVPVAAGTGDGVVIDYDAKVIYGVDLKFGRGDIVYASTIDPETGKKLPNPQVAIYMAAAVRKYQLLGIEDDWLTVGMISQPRANHFDKHEMSVGELRAWMAAQAPAANRAYTLWASPHLVSLSDLTPGEKQCRWCPKSGNCEAQTNKILDKFPKGHAAAVIPMLNGFDDVQIAEHLDLADEIEHWLSAVRADGLRRALAGHVLPNWKMVMGRRGNRALPEEVDTVRVQLDEPTLAEIGVEEIEGPQALPIKDAIVLAAGNAAYAPAKLKTVAQLQKVLEKKAPMLWAALQEHVTQADGKPSLERMEDPRPPMAIVSQEFPQLEPAGKSLV